MSGFFISPSIMKKIIYLLVMGWLVLSGGCGQKKADYNPDTCLTAEKQQKLLQEMVRYANKLAPEATRGTMFNPEFNWYYDRAVGECKILYCLLNEQDSTYRLLVARKARSINPMEEGIALKIKFNQKDSFDLYDEVFRMWKMPHDTLLVRGKFLFDLMVNGGDLSLYSSRFQKDKFIEFPDNRFTFDVNARKWKDKELDSLRFN